MNDLTCRDLIAFLDEYVDGSLSDDRRAAFEQHLQQCRACRSYVATYQSAMRLSREAAASTAEDVPEDLVRAICASRLDRQS
jgi:anti-sigma factor RsiW